MYEIFPYAFKYSPFQMCFSVELDNGSHRNHYTTNITLFDTDLFLPAAD